MAPSTGQHQEVAAQREASPPQGVELRQRQGEGPLAWPEQTGVNTIKAFIVLIKLNWATITLQLHLSE